MTETETPHWLSALENKIKRPHRLAHEIGAGALCITCGDKCPGLDLHFWRKICRNCKCKKEDHDVKDDDGYEQFEILFGSSGNTKKTGALLKLKFLTDDGEKKAVNFDWVPPNVSEEVVAEYMEKLPVTKLPISGSDGAVYRKQQLEKQVPLHDLDVSKCHNLSSEEVERFLEYLENLKMNVVGQGRITKMVEPYSGQTVLYHGVKPQVCESESVNILDKHHTQSLDHRNIELNSAQSKVLDDFPCKDINPLQTSNYRPVDYNETHLRNLNEAKLSSNVEPQIPYSFSNKSGNSNLPNKNENFGGAGELSQTQNVEVVNKNFIDSKNRDDKSFTNKEMLLKDGYIDSAIQIQKHVAIDDVSKSVHPEFAKQLRSSKVDNDGNIIMTQKSNDTIYSNPEILNSELSNNNQNMPPSVIENYGATVPNSQTVSSGNDKYHPSNIISQIENIKLEKPSSDIAYSSAVNSDCMPKASLVLARPANENIQLDENTEDKKNDILYCQECKKDIYPGEVAVIADRAGCNAVWHPGCFVCQICKELLVDLLYFFHKGNVYCGRHYADLVNIPRCLACDELIFVNEYTLAEDKAFHIRHFCCFECDIPLGGKSYTPVDDQPMCLECYEEKFGKKCHTCKQKIAVGDQRVSLKELHWHVSGNCFKCYHCQKSLLGGKFVIKDIQPYCSKECVNAHKT